MPGTTTMLATCLGCGCACDDIQLRIDANRITEARNACDLGLQWFGDGTAPARAVVGTREASVDEALDAASDLLRTSSRVPRLLAPDISCEAQRAAIAIADTLHATVDSVTSTTAIQSILAAQEIGRASATLGEIRNRADVIVFWGVDPSSRYPRFWARYAPGPSGVHVGDRGHRTVIAVDVGEARGPEDADDRLAIPPDREVELLAELTSRATGSAGGGELPPILQRMLQGKYVALIADAEPDGRPSRDAGEAPRSSRWLRRSTTRRVARTSRFAPAATVRVRTRVSRHKPGIRLRSISRVDTLATARTITRWHDWNAAALTPLLIVGSVDRVSPEPAPASPVFPQSSSDRERPRRHSIRPPRLIRASRAFTNPAPLLRMDDVPLPLAAAIRRTSRDRRCRDGAWPASGRVRLGRRSAEREGGRCAWRR